MNDTRVIVVDAPHVDKYRRRGEHIVYSAVDAWGRVLYEGVTSDFPRRMADHARQSDWWVFAASITTGACGSREEAEEIEGLSIYYDQPPYNIVGR